MYINMPRLQTVGGQFVAALLAATIALGSSRPSPADDPPASKADDFSPYVTKEGGISLPTDYREKFLHLGTWAVAKKQDQPVEQMHNVYARRKDIQAYRKDGKFPDGAVLVKEITNVSSDKLKSGQPSWSTDVQSWFVMVKDAKGRFPENALWAEDWGWALFEAKDPKKNVATSFEANCKNCHVPAKKDDWVYIRGYPILAKPIPPK